ncbi:MAG: CotH kinase family protein [Candidatus Yanofskybacteria bacterium]|nr:CotH kinase family protein [Candidatus Yanofskybacteria bacterium]
MKKNNIFHPAYLLVIMIVAIFAYIFFVPLSAKNYFIAKTSIGKWLLPTRLAIKKGYNIIHLPYWIKKSDLPIYHIFISPKNQEELIAGLPFDQETLSYGHLFDEYKKFVNADFASKEDGYGASIKIRYRGVTSGHWSKEQKSYRLKFPKDNLFEGQRGLNLNISADRDYFIEPLNSYRARKMGLPAAEFRFVRLNINNRDSGVYLAFEPWSKGLLARNGFIDTDNIFSSKDFEDFNTGVNLFKVNAIDRWKSYTNEDDTNFEELITLFNLMENADDEEFSRKIGGLFDLESFYRFQLLYLLAGSNHVLDNWNSVLLFKKEIGKFVFVPWDVSVRPPEEFDHNKLTTLAKRILTNDKFMGEFKKVVNDYVSDPNNLKDDLAYHDGLYQKYFPEFYKDQAKEDSDRDFDRKVKKYRALVVENFNKAKELIAGLSPSDLVLESAVYNSGPVNFEGSFKYFNDIFLGIDQFLSENPQFKKINHNSIALSAGEHIFNNVTIVPGGLYFIIEPGAKLLFSPGASLISYSPVAAIGTSPNPIEMRPLRPDSAPWGVFAVINTGGAENKFYYVSVSGGGAEPVINGVPYTSQFNLHDAVSEIFYSTFENGRSDDALHVIGGSVKVAKSVIKNTSSDGIDLDFVKDGSITDSIFFNSKPEGSNGDGIDLSGTEKMEITNNKIVGFGDKCISVGEKAKVVIESNILAGCGVGVAVKDDSAALIERNVIGASKFFGISLYRKKQEFIKGGNAEEIDNIFISNNENVNADEFSSIIAVNKNADVGGKNHDLRSLLPAYMYDLISNTP